MRKSEHGNKHAGRLHNCLWPLLFTCLINLAPSTKNSLSTSYILMISWQTTGFFFFVGIAFFGMCFLFKLRLFKMALLPQKHYSGSKRTCQHDEVVLHVNFFHWEETEEVWGRKVRDTYCTGSFSESNKIKLQIRGIIVAGQTEEMGVVIRLAKKTKTKKTYCYGTDCY